MAFTIPVTLLLKTTSKQLEVYRNNRKDRIYGEEEYEVRNQDLTDDVLDEIILLAKEANLTRVVRASESIKLANVGKFSKPIPNFNAFQAVLEKYLSKDPIDGWIYHKKSDGFFYPLLVTSIYERMVREDETPEMFLNTSAYSYYASSHSKETDQPFRTVTERFCFNPADVARKPIAKVLSDFDLYKETPELKQEYEEQLARYHKDFQPEFAKQFRFTGKAFKHVHDHWRNKDVSFDNVKVIHDTATNDYRATEPMLDTFIFEEGAKVPVHPVIRVYNLKAHEYLVVHVDTLTPYVYDKSLADKLVLPTEHRDLLDIMTTNLDAFVNDFIEGKSAGNVILCKGVPGVGKTLTAEVYSELIDKPLYSIHTGTLGITSKSIEENLKVIFSQAKRWGCVLLLDEADVFVLTRSNDLAQNAIIAEFLRVLEYFDGLLFMTTNRADDIDHAILSRCAAVIAYHLPNAEDLRKIWQVMANQFEAKLDEALLEELIARMPSIAPRDVKMLFRLALRVSIGKGVPLSFEIFRQCAMFRNIDVKN